MGSSGSMVGSGVNASQSGPPKGIRTPPCGMGRLKRHTPRASYETGNSHVKRTVSAMDTTTNAHRDRRGSLRRQRRRRWYTEIGPVCPGCCRTRSKKAELVLQHTLRPTDWKTIRKWLRADCHQGVDG